MNHTRMHVVPALAAALALALSGCLAGADVDDATSGTSSSSSSQAESAPAEAESDAPAEAATAEPEAEAEPEEAAPAEEAEGQDDNGVALFGETLTRDDGLELTVSEPQPFTPSEWAAGGEGSAQHVRFEITITNGTAEKFDPSMIYPTVTSGGVEGEEVFDEGLDGAPMTTVLPGKSVTFPIGFGVEDAADVLMEIELDWEDEPALFATEAARS